MASDFSRLRTMFTPTLDMESPRKAEQVLPPKLYRACSIGSASLALAASLMPVQFLPAMAETLPTQPSAVEAADKLVSRSLLSTQSTKPNQSEEQGGLLPTSVKLLAQASRGSLSEAFAAADVGDRSQSSQLAVSSDAAPSQTFASNLLVEESAADAMAPADGVSSLEQLVEQLNPPQVLAVAPQRAETAEEVRNRLAPGIQPLPTPPQLAPVRFEAAPGRGNAFPGSTAEVVVPTSNFGGAFANSVSANRASVDSTLASRRYLAQAYPQTSPYSPQPGFPARAFPQPGYPQAIYPQPGYYYAQPYPQPVPVYALPQAYAPPPPPYAPPYYPQGAYPQLSPQQPYVAQPYPQYPQPHQVQPYANQGYAVAYPPAGYPQPGYAAQPYPNPIQQPYPNQSYAAQPYPQPGYSYPAPGMTAAVQLPPLPAQGSAAPRGFETYANGTTNGAFGNPLANSVSNNSYTSPYGQPSSIGGRSELPPPPNLSTGNTAFALPSPPVGLSNATSAAVPPQALSEINLNRLPQIPVDPLPLDVPSTNPMAADQLPSGIGGPLDFEAPTLELPPPPLQPRQEVNLPVGQPAPTFRSTALGRPESQLQAVFLTQGGDSAARARLSGTYPLTPNLLFGGSFDVASGDAFTDDTNGFSVNEAFASASLSQLPNLRLVAGQMDLTSYFDRNSFAKDSATHFFNPVFQTNPALSAVGLGSRPGLLANWSATDNLDLKVAAYSSADDIGEFALDGFAGEVGFRTGNAIVRATYASGRDDGSRDGFREVFNIDRGNGRTGVREGDREEAYGVNGELFIPSLNAGIFGRYGRYENRDLGEGGDTYSLGISFLDVFTDEDRLGLAFGRDISNDELRRRFDEDDPNVLELFYDFRFLPNLRMGFSLQERDNFSELAAGFRLKAEFDTLPTGNLSEVR